MAATGVDEPRPGAAARLRDTRRARVVYWCASAALLVIIGLIIASWPTTASHGLGTVALWTVVALVADLMSVRIGDSTNLTMSVPTTIAAAMVLTPLEAVLVSFVGQLDRDELRGESSFPRALYNRLQVAIATAAAASVFQATPDDVMEWPAIIVWSSLALLADFVVNTSLVVAGVVVRTGTGVRRAFGALFGYEPLTSVALYASFALIAPLMAMAFTVAGPWGLLACLVPIALGWSVLLTSQRLHEAMERIGMKDRALGSAASHLVEERRDERLALAGDLHDDVLPALFKVHLMGQVLKQDLSTGHLLALDDDLPELLSATEMAQTSIRRVVSDLRKSPLGPGGLVATLRAHARQLEASSRATFDLRIEEPGGSDRALLVAYQVAREAMVNAARYSKADSISVTISSEDGAIQVTVSDEGVGFDASATLSDHFGIHLMRERVEAVGGSLFVDSRLGVGTVVFARIPPGT